MITFISIVIGAMFGSWAYKHLTLWQGAVVFGFYFAIVGLAALQFWLSGGCA